MQSLCSTCAWKDLEAPGFSKKVMPIEVCLYSKPVFPHAKNCDGYQERVEDRDE
jgi:hypothetical protein